MVSPDKAEAYFGACSPGRKCLRGTLNGTAADLFSLTPYAKERDWYRYSWTPQDVKAVPGHGLFRLRKWPRLVVPVHRFQWHDGGVARLKDELERYRGTCTVDGTAESEESCTALIPQWKEMAALYRSAAVSGRVDVVGAGCDSVPAEDDVQENTAYMGLAWEEFDESLGVVSKVRNTVKGDSQTRMASLAAGGEDEEA